MAPGADRGHARGGDGSRGPEAQGCAARNRRNGPVVAGSHPGNRGAPEFLAADPRFRAAVVGPFDAARVVLWVRGIDGAIQRLVQDAAWVEPRRCQRGAARFGGTPSPRAHAAVEPDVPVSCGRFRAAPGRPGGRTHRRRPGALYRPRPGPPTAWRSDRRVDRAVGNRRKPQQPQESQKPHPAAQLESISPHTSEPTR